MVTSPIVPMQLVVADHGQLALWLLTLVPQGLYSVEMSKELVKTVESGMDHHPPVLVKIINIS